MINKFKERRVDHINGIIRQVEDCNRRAKVHNYSTGNKMNDSEYQEIKRRWDNKHSEINKLIAYVEELREENEKLRERFEQDTHFKILQEENAKLKGLVFALRGHMEISSWTNKEQRLAQMNLELEEENEILEAQKDGLREIVAKDDVLINKLKEENEKLNEELRIERIER